MMAKKPDRRYQTAQEVADVLADWLTAHGHGSSLLGGSGSWPTGARRRVAACRSPAASYSGEDARPATLAKTEEDFSAADTMSQCRPADRQGAATDPHARAGPAMFPSPRSAARSARPSTCPWPRRWNGDRAGLGVRHSHRRSAGGQPPPLARPEVTDEQMAAYRRRRKNPRARLGVVRHRGRPAGRRNPAGGADPEKLLSEPPGTEYLTYSRRVGRAQRAPPKSVTTRWWGSTALDPPYDLTTVGRARRTVRHARA